MSATRRTLGGLALLGAVVAASGCGGPAPCAAGGSGVLASRGDEALGCDAAAAVPEWARRVAGRRAHAADRSAMLTELADEFLVEPDRARARIAAAKAFVDELDGLTGTAAAERRATEGFAVVAGESPITAGREALGTLTLNAMSVWAKDPTERLVLTEVDIEGWMRFASLCRELQSAPPLRVSIADRVTVYKLVVEAFARAPRAGKIGLVALGGSWPELEQRWPAVSYEQQQRWATRAPLPPPMEATSLAYVEALAATDPAGMASALFAGVGDLPQRPAD